MTVYRFHSVRLVYVGDRRWKAVCDDCRWRWERPVERDEADMHRKQHMAATHRHGIIQWHAQ